AVYNRTRSRAEPLAQAGARIADSPRDAARDADFVFAMVSDDPASREVWLGENGALSGAKQCAILLDCSTLTPRWVKELGQLAAERGCHFLDAPVTGSKPQADAGELGFFIGGDAETVERARPVLEPLSVFIHHMGPTGSGAMYKLINNLIGG